MKNSQVLNPNSRKALMRSSTEVCDFCDSVFNNRYDSIVHNASHIIIPLLKQTFYPCKSCSLFFSSQEDLNTHKISQHDKTLKRNSKVNGTYPINGAVIEIEDSDDEKPLVNKVKSEPIKNRLKFEDDLSSNGILKDLITECKVNVQLFNKWDTSLKEADKLDVRNVTDKIKGNKESNKISNPERIDKPDKVKLPKLTGIRNGIETVTSNNIKTNGIKGCMEAKDTGKPTISQNTKTVKEIKEAENIKKQAIAIKEKIKQNTEKPLKLTDKGVGIETITNKTTVKIANGHDKTLKNDFNNTLTNATVENGNTVDIKKRIIDRLVIEDSLEDEFSYDNYVTDVNEIKYESIHYSCLMKPGIFNCRYCSGSYPNRFSLIQHETTHIRIKTRVRLRPKHHNELKSCHKCGIQYKKFKKHAKSHHPEEVPRHKSSKVLKVCELCFSFMKGNQKLKYILIGNSDFNGVRQSCDVCRKLFFELVTVKRICCGIRCAMRERRKGTTNEDRLKNIQDRLKKLKLLNKF